MNKGVLVLLPRGVRYLVYTTYQRETRGVTTPVEEMDVYTSTGESSIAAVTASIVNKGVDNFSFLARNAKSCSLGGKKRVWHVSGSSEGECVVKAHAITSPFPMTQ